MYRRPRQIARVKDRFGRWQDIETRKQIYQDQMTQQLRAEAASVRRQIRLGVGLPSSPSASDKTESVDLHSLLERLTPEQCALMAARLKVQGSGSVGPSVGPNANAPGPTRIPARLSPDLSTALRERATGLEPATSSLGSWHSTN